MSRPRKLTPAQEAAILAAWRLRRDNSNKALAQRYGVSTTTVRSVITCAIKARSSEIVP